MARNRQWIDVDTANYDCSIPALIKKWLLIVVGGTLILAGLITFWLPLPIGLPMVLLGLPLVLRHSPHARSWWDKLRNRCPLLTGKQPMGPGEDKER